MKFCMVAYTFYEGDNRVRRYAESLVKRGDEVDVIVLRQNDSDSFARVSGVNVYKIQKRDLNEKRKVDYLLKLVAFLWRSAVTLTKLHLSKRYNLIHIHSVPDFEVFAALIPKLMGARVILDIHDIVPELFASKFKVGHSSPLFYLLVLIERLSMAFADHVIVANHLWYGRLISRSVPSCKCTVVMNYPDQSLFVPTEKRTCNPKGKVPFRLIYPGTLSLHQGLETAIKAVDLLRNQIPGLELHIYGKGTDESYFLQLVKLLDLQQRVLFNGIVPIERLGQVIGEADIGIEPKQKRGFGNEAFSTKILEFMLMRVPVIASDTLVHKHYFTDRLVKFFKSEDHHDLARCIVELMENRNMRNDLVDNSSLFMKENNWEVRKHIYHGLVDSLVKR